MIWFLLAAGALIVEVSLSPRLGFTSDGHTLLWYGRSTRKYIRII